MSRPTMARMMRSSLTTPAAQSSVSMVLPSRITVIWSATWVISLSLCEIRMQAMPWALSPRSSCNRAALSVSFRLAVGSSRISSLTRLDKALAISTNCCLPMPSLPTMASGDSFSPTRLSSSRVRTCAACQSITPPRASSLPRKMFSVTDSVGTRASSWWMMMMPRASLSLMS